MRGLRERLAGAGWPEGERLLPVVRRVPVPESPRRIARRMTFALAGLVLFAALAPWRQNLPGSGQVVAFTPDQRPQPVPATIHGRVLRWHVFEGQPVEAGELLVELSDNDPERLDRLRQQVAAAEARLEAYRNAVEAQQERIEALRRSQRAQLDAARQELRVAQQAVQAQREAVAAAEARAATAERQRRRISELAVEGLASERERELVELAATNASTNLASQRARLRAAEASLGSRRAALARTEASTEADLRSATASLRSAQTQVASAEVSLLDAQSRLAQQSAQEIHAVRAGVVQRIAVQQGVQVSRGTALAWIVPRADRRSVALYVDGNDAALIAPGRPVRLQFEGWPAVQFAGWPSAAVGTFGGRVAFVDPSDDGRGDFRVMVVPDPDDEPWPSATFLRQGTRAKGWVLLEEVSVGFEVWRQLNGFPPAYRSVPGSPPGFGEAHR